MFFESIIKAAALSMLSPFGIISIELLSEVNDKITHVLLFQNLNTCPLFVPMLHSTSNHIYIFIYIYIYIYILEGEWRVLTESEVQRCLNWKPRAITMSTIGSIHSKQNRHRRSRNTGKPKNKNRRTKICR